MYQSKQGTDGQDQGSLRSPNQLLNSGIIGSQGLYIDNYEITGKGTETTNYGKYFQPLQGNFDQQSALQSYTVQTPGNNNSNYTYMNVNSSNSNGSNNMNVTNSGTVNDIYGVINEGNNYQSNELINQHRYPGNNMTTNLLHNSNNNIKNRDDQTFDIRYNSVGTLTSTSNMSSIMTGTEASSVSHAGYNMAANKGYLPATGENNNYFNSDSNSNYYSKQGSHTNNSTFTNSRKNSGSFVCNSDDITSKSAVTQYAPYQTPANEYNLNTAYTNSTNEENIVSLKNKLHLKDVQLESLENEIRKLKEIFNKGIEISKEKKNTMDQDYNITVKEIEVPNSLDIIFRKLSTALQNREKELEEANNNLESLLTALALNPTNPSIKFGRYDPEELAHKTVVRLETLTKENQEMARMLSFGRAKEKQIAFEILKKENKELKDQIKQLNEKLAKEKS